MYVIIIVAGAPGWQTGPFHFIYGSFTILYGYRAWRTSQTIVGILFVAASTGLMTFVAIAANTEGWPEMTKVPLMTLMFLAMVFHVRRRQEATAEAQRLATERARDLERQKV